MPDIRQLRRFVAVAEEKNFRRAAARLNVSQPPLSASIQSLEDEVGTQLLLRNRRRVALTEAGEAFLDRARLILSQLDDSVALAQAVAQGRSGQLTLGFIPTATYELLPRLLKSYRAAYPDVGLRFVELTTPEQPAALLQNRIDVGLFLVPTTIESGVAQETLLKERLYVAMPDDHRLARQSEIELGALRDEPFVFIPPRSGTGYHARVSHACQQAGFMPTVVEAVEHLNTMVSLVGAGMGMALVAASLQRFRPPGVIFRPLADPADLLYLEYGMAWRSENRSATVDGFLDVARGTAPGRFAP